MSNNTRKEKLRPVARQRILDVLDKTYFGLNGFHVAFSDPQDYSIAAKIMLIDHPQFTFIMVNVSTGWLTRECPGLHLNEEETYGRDNLEDCVEALIGWVERILADFRSQYPIADEFDRLRQSLMGKIDARFAQVDGDTRFTFGEIQNLKVELESLKSKFAELAKKHVITQEDLNRLEGELNVLKNDLTAMPKKTWYKALGSKIVGGVKAFVKTPEGQKLLAESAERVVSDVTKLLEHTK